MVNVNDAAEQGDTALHLACLYGEVEVVSFLLDSGADTTVMR